MSNEVLKLVYDYDDSLFNLYPMEINDNGLFIIALKKMKEYMTSLLINSDDKPKMLVKKFS